MGERESHGTSAESRRDVVAKPVHRRGREEAIKRYLGAAMYQQLKSEESADVAAPARPAATVPGDEQVAESEAATER